MQIGDLLDLLLARARVPIRVKVDPARYRPNDNRVIVGDPRRIHRRVGLGAHYPHGTDHRGHPLVLAASSHSRILSQARHSIRQKEARRGLSASACSSTGVVLTARHPRHHRGEYKTNICTTRPMFSRCSSIPGEGSRRRATSPNVVKEGGTAALTEAERRADAARYQEVTCRSALNRVKGMPFNWTLNPYRGCTHGCHYCFARRYHVQFEMNADDEFASVILVKRNFVEVLERGARSAVVDARAGRVRHRDRSVPADRRPLPADAPRDRGARARTDADRPRHEGTDGRARPRRAAGADRAPQAARST